MICKNLEHDYINDGGFITSEETNHLEKLENTPLFEDEDLAKLGKLFPEDE